MSAACHPARPHCDRLNTIKFTFVMMFIRNPKRRAQYMRRAALKTN
jgi:hypothetical protein